MAKRDVTAADIMTRDVETVPDVMPVRELAAFLINRQISGAPVADRNGRLVGVVSLTDIVESDAEGGGYEREGGLSPFYVGGWERRMSLSDFQEAPLEDDSLEVKDIMTPTLYTVPADTTAKKMAKTMVAGHLHRLLVTEKEQVVGIVTSLDLLKVFCEG